MQLPNLQWRNLEWVRRLLACLLFVCAANGALGQSEQPVDPPLDAPALAMQMLHLHPHLDLKRYALGYLQFESPLQYNSILHDKVALKTTLDALTETLALQRTSAKKLPELRLDTIGEVIKLKGDNTAMLSSLLSSGAIPIDNNERVFEGFLPSSFFTLFPNASLASETAITAEFARYVASRLLNQDRTPIYISAYFRAVRFQQSNVVQTYLTRVKFYTDAERTKLLQEKVEKRNGPALIARALLVDGLTFNANPDHSTVINGEYMLEFFPAAGWEQQQCQSQNQVRGHRVWLCRRDLPKIEGEAIERTEHLYVGGRLAQIAFVIVKAAPIVNINEVKQSMAERYGGVFNEKQMQYQWQQQSTFYQVDFSMLKNSKKPYLVIRAGEYQALLDGKPGYEPVP
jgi:hypothetical protein